MLLERTISAPSDKPTHIYVHGVKFKRLGDHSMFINSLAQFSSPPNGLYNNITLYFQESVVG